MPEDSFDPWRTLGVPVGAGPDEIQRAFRSLARRKHPDVNRDAPDAHEQFIRLRQAYETLMDDEMRARLEREALQADLEPIVIIESIEVTLQDAYELLERGYTEEARDLYLEMARDHPGDPRLLELLDAIRRVEGGGRAAPHTAQRPSPATERDAQPTASRTRESYRDLWEPEPISVQWWLVALAILAVIICTAAVGRVDAAPILAGYSVAEIGLCMLAGFAGMALIAASGLVGSFDWELGGVVGDSGSEAPLWLYLGVAGLVSPLLALIFYLVFVALQTQWSWDVVAYFAGTFVVAGVICIAHGSGAVGACLVASSAVFVPGLMGWAFGSIFRPGHWWQ